MWLRVLRSLSVRLARMERAGDQGPELAAAFDDPPVALAEEGIGLRRGGRDLAQGALDLLPLPVLPERFFAPDWMVRGDSFARDTRCPGVGKTLISSPISARMAWAAWRPMPGTSSR